MIRKEVQALAVIFVVVAMGLTYAAYEVNTLRGEINELRNTHDTIIKALYTQVDELENLIVECEVNIDNSTTTTTHTVYLTKGATALEALRRVAVVETKYYAGMGEFIVSINGVANDTATGKYWMWYIWNENDANWSYAPVGAGSYVLEDGENIMFRYEVPSW
jgi:hypothetical protein